MVGKWFIKWIISELKICLNSLRGGPKKSDLHNSSIMTMQKISAVLQVTIP